AALVQMLVKGEADILALPIPTSTISANGLRAAGVVDAATKQSWAVKKNASQLAEALNQWFSPELLTKLDLTTEERIKKLREVKRTMQAVYLSPSRGIISVYDNLFKKASAETGWDWRLIAAQAYQESGFDPNARSWAGAQGLMQLMPATARSVGVDPSEVFQPEKNVAGASKYLVLLNKQFSDIQDARERIKFVLAAYNGGAGHIRDAMALARKYGKNPIYWHEVAPFVLALQKPEFYRDPVVRYGYLIGTETESYVRAILERYQSYGGHVMLERAAAMPFDRSSSSVSATNEPQQTPMVKNKYSSGTPILSPDDPEFNQMGNTAMSK
ncbi:MAG: transglycosylase SLT domain-containing protein, partial [Bacteroidaceae bacterium]|nr:transglycosylase SLT domain-containing protein [Bacteroidaceae bacterium]